MRRYDHSKIEKKWQKRWQEEKLYRTPDRAADRDNFYLLVEFPYPSGNLHVGHWYAFAVPDILARYLRMRGKNVLYPIGFDAFGLPAENAAIKHKLNPRDWTEENIAYMTKQIESMGTSFDWSRAVSTIDPHYYRWTQWLFLRLFKKGLAYQKETSVNWCPKDKTVLANEQVVNGKCERCDSEVVQKQMLQWNLKITDYADRLVDDLEPLDWPEEIKEAQRNWIGRSDGAEIDFPLVIDADKTKYTYLYLHGHTSGADRPRNHWYRKHLEALGHTVVIPELPNTNNPVEAEQVAAALGAARFDERTILVGHSLGGVVAMKALLESGTKIAGLVLIAPAMDPRSKAKAGGDRKPFHDTFDWRFDYERIKELTKYRIVLSDLQETHRISYLRDLAQKLDARLVETNAAGEHFTGDREPDVLMWLRPTIRVFTTRPDTLFGATYLVLAPEHPWVELALQHKTVLKNDAEIRSYVDQANKKTELERQENREKTGVKLEGVAAINPASGERIPIFVADYVLAHYGTGAIMAVPAHDERDFVFARKFGLPMKQVVAPVIRGVGRGGGVVREGEPFHVRDAVMCIVKHWENDEYLCIQLKGFDDIKTFVSGGIEEGEDAVEAGIREIREESGYQNPVFVRTVGPVQIVEFYHQSKRTNARVTFRYLYFELRDGEQKPLASEEDAKHTLYWKKGSEVLSFLSFNDKEQLWRYFERGDTAYAGGGEIIDSGELDGMSLDQAKKKAIELYGRAKKTYKLRDWIVSRQRYWGVPIPIIHCQTCGPVAVPDEELPVKLPEVEDYLPAGDGASPLAKVNSFVNARCPQCGGEGKRETDTLDTFVDSSWYFLRYTDPNNDKEFAARSAQARWMPVDLYSGGAEHTTMHLLYSRFWHKALYDLGLVADPEPYKRRMNRSLIMGPDGQKMSKSRGNVIDPDAVVATLGADTVRLYLAFIGPYNEVGSYPWNPDGVVGVRRFLERLWRLQDLVQDENVAKLDGALHKTIKKVGEDTVALKFNTAIAQFMVFLNAVEKASGIGSEQWKMLLRLLAPYAPHMTEELWRLSGNPETVHRQEWPRYDDALLVDAEVTVAVQIDGKTRGEVRIARDADQAALQAAARAAVAKRLEGRAIARTIVVQGRLINFVLQG